MKKTGEYRNFLQTQVDDWTRAEEQADWEWQVACTEQKELFDKWKKLEQEIDEIKARLEVLEYVQAKAHESRMKAMKIKHEYTMKLIDTI